MHFYCFEDKKSLKFRKYIIEKLTGSISYDYFYIFASI